MNGPAVANARLDWHGSEWRNLDLTSGEAFYVKPQKMLHRFESKSVATAVQSFITTTSLEGVVTTARPSICSIRSKTLTGPVLKLFDGNCSERSRA